MNKHEFDDHLRTNPLPVVVDIWAPWCMPCRMIEPALHQFEKDYVGRVDVWKINADENADLLQSLGVSGIPTLLIFQGDREILRSTGAQPQARLRSLFESALAGEAPAQVGIPFTDRLIRLFLGISVAGISWFQWHSIPLLILGGAIVFSAVYDRCPIWRAITSRLKHLQRKSSEANS